MTAGARTQVSALTTAALAVLTALFLAPVLSDLPEATLGAVVIVSVTGLLSLKDVRRVAAVDRLELLRRGGDLSGRGPGQPARRCDRRGRRDLRAPAARPLLTLSSAEARAASRRGDLRPVRAGGPPLTELAGLLILRVEGVMFTVNIRGVQERILAAAAARDPAPDVLIVDVSGTAGTSVYVMDVFGQLAEQLERREVQLWVAGLPTTALDKARRAVGWSVWAGAGRLHPNVEVAVTAFLRSAAGPPGAGSFPRQG